MTIRKVFDVRFFLTLYYSKWSPWLQFCLPKAGIGDIGLFGFGVEFGFLSTHSAPSAAIDYGRRDYAVRRIGR